MTRVFLISDTHSYIDERILHYAAKADQIWHAGDIGSIEVTDSLASIKPLRAVYGNIDDHNLRVQFPKELLFDCEGVSVLLTHIAGYPKKYNALAQNLIQQHQPNLVICGHSHILKVMKDSQYGHLHMNPGAAGIHGFHQIRTALEFTIDNDSILDLKVIEFGARGAAGLK